MISRSDNHLIPHDTILRAQLDCHPLRQVMNDIDRVVHHGRGWARNQRNGGGGKSRGGRRIGGADSSLWDPNALCGPPSSPAGGHHVSRNTTRFTADGHSSTGVSASTCGKCIIIICQYDFLPLRLCQGQCKNRRRIIMDAVRMRRKIIRRII